MARRAKRLKPSSIKAYTNYMLWIHLDHNLATIKEPDQPAPFRLVGNSIFKLHGEAYWHHCTIQNRSELINVIDEVASFLGV